MRRLRGCGPAVLPTMPHGSVPPEATRRAARRAARHVPNAALHAVPDAACRTPRCMPCHTPRLHTLLLL